MLEPSAIDRYNTGGLVIPDIAPAPATDNQLRSKADSIVAETPELYPDEIPLVDKLAASGLEFAAGPLLLGDVSEAISGQIIAGSSQLYCRKAEHNAKAAPWHRPARHNVYAMASV